MMFLASVVKNFEVLIGDGGFDISLGYGDMILVAVSRANVNERHMVPAMAT